jgi:chromosome partitioning protein
MIITFASYKGGVGKSTSAVHFAAYLQQLGPTLFIDGDPNRGVFKLWAAQERLPFTVIDEDQAPKYISTGKYKHLVIDTKAREGQSALEQLSSGCDLLIVPTTPDPLAVQGLIVAVNDLQHLNASKYRILITKIPPHPRLEGEDTQKALIEQGFPVFQTMIRRIAAFEKAPGFGVPVYNVPAYGADQGWQDYVSACKEVINE